MNQISQLFDELKAKDQTALMPFITAGDPDLDFTAELIVALDKVGCHVLELGFPYSDPIADGPIIQESYGRALKNDLGVNKIFEMVEKTIPKIKMPVVGMVSYSIIFRIGVESFIARAAKAGFAGLIVPDLPLEESGLIAEVAAKNKVAINPLVTPMTEQSRAVNIANSATGFVYFVSVVGTTGERNGFAAGLSNQINDLRAICPQTPICIGFGISQPEHVSKLAGIADGLIVGSAFVRRIAECESKGQEKTIGEVLGFAESLLKALD